MLYPPVLYYFFFWAKGMSFPSVLFLWVGLSVLGFGLAGWWMHQLLASSVKANARWFVVVWLLLAAQFPTLFSWGAGQHRRTDFSRGRRRFSLPSGGVGAGLRPSWCF